MLDAVEHSSEVKANDAQFEIVEEMFDIGGSHVCVRLIGDISNPAIVMLHGLQSHAGVWEKIAYELTDQGYYVVMPDRRGHGYSEHASSYHMFDYVADLNLVIRRYVQKPFILVGHCESCYLVASLAGALPASSVEQLVMIQYPVPARTRMDIETKTDLVETFLRKNAEFVEHPKFNNMEQAAEHSRLGAPFPMPIDVARFVVQRNVTQNEDQQYSWRWHSKLLNYRVLYSTHDLDIIQESIKRVESPVKFIHGESSTLIETNKDRILAYTSELNPRSSQHFVSGGHYPHLEPGYKEVVKVIIN